MTVTVGHTDGRSFALRANQAEPQVAEGSTGGARWGVNGHFKLLTGSHYVGHDGDKTGQRHLVARIHLSAGLWAFHQQINIENMLWPVSGKIEGGGKAV